MKFACVLLIAVALLASVARSDDDLHRRWQYTLRAGDVLDLHYRYTPELDQTVKVLPDGMINLNVVGNVKVSDLTVEQAHDAIIAKAKDHLNDPELNLVLKEFQPPYVVVAGEVYKPGTINLRENTTALQAILMAGGFLASAQSGQVILIRKVNTDMAEVRILHLAKIRKTADLEKDVQLEPGDMLYVTRNKVEKLSRYIKLANFGTSINPFPVVP